MFNLLPKSEKDAIRREYRVRLAVVILWFSFMTLLIGAVLLLPAYVLSVQKEKTALRQSETLSKSVEVAEAAHLEDVLLDVKNKLQFMRREAPTIRLYELIREAAKRRSEGISFENLAVTAGSIEGRRRFIITGVSATRNALVVFEKSLKGSGLFENVSLPVSNLAKDSNSEFSLTAEGKF